MTDFNDIDVIEDWLFKEIPGLMEILISDNTSGKKLHWATEAYSEYGTGYAPEDEMKIEQIIGRYTSIIQPRTKKSLKEQIRRTRDKGEVFTPSWMCNLQNNIVDAEWFGREDIFNIADGSNWIVNLNPIPFELDGNKTWKDYIKARRLEISCGEAPYLVSRYDTVSGDEISIMSRVGLLDRKLRVVCENTETEEDWFKWVKIAFQNVYGYELQGDNVLLARENLLCTFVDYMNFKFKHKPTGSQILQIAKIISWNIWQMDAMYCSVPYEYEKAYEPTSLFPDITAVAEEQSLFRKPILCKIRDWRAGGKNGKIVRFRDTLG